MITIFSASNRPDNKTIPFAKAYYQIIQSHTKEPVKLLDFRDLSPGLLHSMMYDESNQSEQIKDIQDSYLLASEKWVFFIPEYNGSFPGILKLFIDACSIRKYKETFRWKKAAIIGISEGRSGNIRGMEHFTAILNHMGTAVFPDKLPISQIAKLIDMDNQQIEQGTLHLLEKHATEFVEF
ncbi:MAG TPA: NAD(P)H-dependent oxidoreductase [Saprospiraceae bacterium]|nr:NAD(P)H-dependent oxidoreductase [Saprospiraceae bacterium]